jgi:WD40 repeat protein
LRTVEGHADVVESIAVSDDGKRLLTASRDHTVRVWDTASGRQESIFTQHKSAVLAVAIAPDGTVTVSGGDDKVIRKWKP